MLRLLYRWVLCPHPLETLGLLRYLTLQTLKIMAGMASSSGLPLVTPMRQELVLARLSLGTDVYISQTHIQNL